MTEQLNAIVTGLALSNSEKNVLALWRLGTIVLVSEFGLPPMWTCSAPVFAGALRVSGSKLSESPLIDGEDGVEISGSNVTHLTPYSDDLFISLLDGTELWIVLSSVRLSH